VYLRKLKHIRVHIIRIVCKVKRQPSRTRPLRLSLFSKLNEFSNDHFSSFSAKGPLANVLRFHFSTRHFNKEEHDHLSKTFRERNLLGIIELELELEGVVDIVLFLLASAFR
jgi:hypothetical protein